MDAKRPAIVSLLAVLQIIGGAFWMLGAIVGLVRAVLGSGEPQADAIMLVVAVVCGVIGGLQLACGAGLWQLKPIGRTLQVVFAWIGLLGIPVGTVISILILIYLNKPGIKLLFSGRPTSEWSQEEFAQLAALPQTSVAVVVILALVLGVGGVMVLGIVAAIAVPGLLRARMSANEAAAIGALRAISSGEASYASSCASGGYAVTLEDLARPPRGSASGFISPELRHQRCGRRVTGSPHARCRAWCHHRRDRGGHLQRRGGHPRRFGIRERGPVTPGGTGTRYFATDGRGILVASPEPITNPIVVSPTVSPPPVSHA